MALRFSTLGVVGPSGSGKTTLIEKLLERFKEKGLFVNVVKSSHHDVTLEPDHKDSARFRRATFGEVLLVSPYRYMIARELTGEKPQLTDLLSRLNSADLTLVEGYQEENIPKLEVLREGVSQQPLYETDETIVAVASNRQRPRNLPRPMAWFDLNAPQEIVAWLLLA